MNRLRGNKFYLAGCMDDNVPDRGAGWRKDMQKFLFSKNIGVLNPCSKPTTTGNEDFDAFEYRRRLLGYAREAEQIGRFNSAKKYYDDVHEVMKDIVATDLKMVDQCDAMVLYIDREYHMCGSYHEAAYATLQRTPVIVNCKQGKSFVPDWLFGVLQHDLFFDSWDKVKSYIDFIDTSLEVEEHNRWRFFDFDMIYGGRLG